MGLEMPLNLPKVALRWEPMTRGKSPKAPLIERIQRLIYEFAELGVAGRAAPSICRLMQLAKAADTEANRPRLKASHKP